jgi:hypothetical protein
MWLALDDTVLELRPLEGRKARILVLGRRTLFLVRRDGDGLHVEDRLDLSPYVPPRSRVDRRAVGCLELVSSGFRAGQWVRVRSTALGGEDAGEVLVRWESDRLLPAGPLESAGPSDQCDAFEDGRAAGWPGRVVTIGSGMRFHALPGGGLGVNEGPVAADAGEPLLARGSMLYASSSSRPRELDRILELDWDGTEPLPGRMSREFSGRVAAAAFLDSGVAVAVVDVEGRSTLHVLDEADLWGAIPP